MVMEPSVNPSSSPMPDQSARGGRMRPLAPIPTQIRRLPLRTSPSNPFDGGRYCLVESNSDTLLANVVYLALLTCLTAS